ncbi:MAG: hypothetical protein QM783_14795 [Phycisphaerales bacterium]
MNWRSYAPIFLQLFVVSVTLCVGLIAFKDHKSWYDVPGRVLLSTSSIFFSMLIADMIWLKEDAALSNAKNAAPLPGHVIAPTQNLRAQIGILFLGGFCVWLLSLLCMGQAGRAATVEGATLWARCVCILVLTIFYFFAGIYVGLASNMLAKVKTQ